MSHRVMAHPKPDPAATPRTATASTAVTAAVGVGVAFLCLSLAGCLDAEPRDPLWSTISPTVLQPSCGTASCHSSLTASGGVILDTREDGYQTLVVAPLDGYAGYVVPGQPGSSHLVQLLRATEVRRMPPDVPLPEADVALIEAWISLGASDL